MTNNFRLNQENLKLKNLNFDNELKLLDSNLEEIKKMTDEEAFWKKTQLITETVIKLHRFCYQLNGEFIEYNYKQFETKLGYSLNQNRFIFDFIDRIFYLIEEYLFGIKTLCSFIDNYGFLAKVYPNEKGDPHIHLFHIGHDLEVIGILFLTNEIPQNVSDLCFPKEFDKTDKESKIFKLILEWANSTNKNGINNWENAKTTYKQLNNFTGKFKSKDSIFITKSLDKIEKYFQEITQEKFKAKKFKAKKFRKRNFNVRKFKLKNNPLPNNLIKFSQENISLPKNFNILEEMRYIGNFIAKIIFETDKFSEKKIWKELINIVKKLQIINKYYDINVFVIDEILSVSLLDNLKEFFFSFYKVINGNNYTGIIYTIDQPDPHIHIFDKNLLYELGKLFITNETPQNESDLRFSEDSDKDIPPEILKDIIRFAKDHWLCFKSGWAEINYGDACRSWEENHDNCDYPWFKSKDDQFSVK